MQVVFFLLLAGSAAALTWGFVKREWGWFLLAGFLAVTFAMLLPLSSPTALVALLGLFSWAGGILMRYRRGRGQLFDSMLLAMPALLAYFRFVEVYGGWIRGYF